MSNKVVILDDPLIEKIANLDPKEQRDYLFLAPHGKYAGRWFVDSLDPSFMFDFEDVVGRHRTVSPASLDRFKAHADDLGYNVIFEDDPANILSAWDHLNDPPQFSLNSDLPNTINGFLPFQLQGFNYLRNLKNKGGYAVWSTGTGKTALIAGLIKQHIDVEQDFDLALVMVKKNNKYDMQRKLDQLGDIGSHIIEGPMRYRNVHGEWVSGKREKIYELIGEQLHAGIPVVAISNYEKFRDDFEYFEALLENRRVLIFWDEMPTKLSNRDSQLYGAVRHALYGGSTSQIRWGDKRLASLRQYGTSATPIENTPVGLLNQVRLIDPEVWPTITGWNNKYVASRNPFSKEPETFKDVDQIGLEIEFMTHQVDKSDPDIARMFPKFTEEPVYIDWGDDRYYYDKLVDIAKDLAEAEKKGEGSKFNALQMIGALQMICDAPSMINVSAENRDAFDDLLAEAEMEGEEPEVGGLITGSEAAQALADGLKKPLSDEKSAKLEKLREYLCIKHPDEKVIVFSSWAGYFFPILEAKFREWEVTYATFKGTDKQRQEAKDLWRADPTIQVFLSSDAGSDSIDLPEASVVIHYNLPWTYARLVQRQNRAHRINSKHESVVVYTLLMARSIEDRKAEVVSKKLGFHRGIFKGEIAEDMISARMTSADLWYILTGDRPDDIL